jgi:glycosyltransferase involved in cell wall biosynthesis
MTTPLHIEQASAVVDVSRAHVFPNTCVPPGVAPRDRPIEDRAPAGRCQAVYVGRLSHLKGTYDLIAAIALLLRSSVDFTFVLIGVGQTAEDDERVARLVAEHQFGDRVVLAGRVSDEEKWRILAESQVMVFPSLGELFPVTLVEGLAAGLPIVTTSVDYLPRLIVHAENGLVVPPGSPHDLANALLALSRDPEMRQRMSRANRLKFEKEFALDVVAGKLREVYQGILEDVR